MEHGGLPCGVPRVLTAVKRKTVPALLALSAILLTGCARGGRDVRPPYGVPEDPSCAAVPSAAGDAESPQTEVSSLPEGTSLPERTAQPEQTAPPEAPAAPVRAPLPSGTAASLKQTAAAYGCTGAQVAVIIGGQVRYSWKYGYANTASGTPVAEDTKFRAASLSKAAVAMVTLCAAGTGAFGLDDDVGGLLGYPVRAPRWPDVPVTLRMLLTHTSSLTDGEAFLDSRGASSSAPLQTVLRSAGSFTGAKPGTRYVYSNLGAAVLAAAVEKRMNKPFYALAEEYLFAPLGLDCAFSAADLKRPELLADLYLPGGGVGWSVRRQLQEAPSQTLGQTHHIYQGNLTVSACDYAELLCLLLNDGCAGGARVLPEGAAAEILKAQFSGGGRQYGLFISYSDSVIPGRTVAYHTGSNFGMYAAFAFDPQTGTGAVALTSGASGAADGSGIYAVCAKMLRACFGAAE